AAPARAADLDKYLPDGAQFIVSFNVKQLLNAPLIKSDKKAFDEGMEHATKGLQDFGIDPKKDLDRVILAMSEDVQKALIFLEGRFDAPKIEASWSRWPRRTRTSSRSSPRLRPRSSSPSRRPPRRRCPASRP